MEQKRKEKILKLYRSKSAVGMYSCYLLDEFFCVGCRSCRKVMGVAVKQR